MNVMCVAESTHQNATSFLGEGLTIASKALFNLPVFFAFNQMVGSNKQGETGENLA